MFSIPEQYIAPYLISNGVALALLLMAFWRPAISRWGLVVIFAAASLANAWHATYRPLDYLDYGDLAVLSLYQQFIRGWFSQHVTWFVYPIAFCQLVIAALLTLGKPWRRVGEVGAGIFLLAIAPLGVGSALPFSFIVVAAIVVMERALEATEWHHHLQIRTFTT